MQIYSGIPSDKSRGPVISCILQMQRKYLSLPSGYQYHKSKVKCRKVPHSTIKRAIPQHIGPWNPDTKYIIARNQIVGPTRQETLIRS